MGSFTKPALGIADQIALLQARGLSVADSAAAGATLARIGYYRFSGYTRAFQDAAAPTSHQFRPGVEFDTVVALYNFDRRLRLVMLGAIERIEIAFRAHVTNVMSAQSGAHWYLDAANMEKSPKHDKLLAQILKEIRLHDPASQSLAVKHYLQTYDHPLYPPSWVILEELSFGTISRMMSDLQRRHRKAIADSFAQLDESIVSSWVRALAYTRNLCAHHARVWNRTFTITPKAAKAIQPFLRPGFKGHFEQDTVYANAVVIRTLLLRVGDAETFRDQLKELADQRPDLQQRMGFPARVRSHGAFVHPVSDSSSALPSQPPHGHISPS